MIDPLSWIATGVSSLASMAASIEGNVMNARSVEATNQANLQATRETNATNLQSVRETNAANIEQANLAYSRSLPVNQVRDLMDAGMSKAGALTKLAGGGVYTPPALQAATADAAKFMPKSFDFSKVGEAFERLGNIPANVQQYELNKTQLENAKQDIELRRKAAEREEEQHRFNIWKQKYDKDQALLLDSASSKLANALLDSGKSIEDFKDFNDIVRKLNLQNDEDIRNLTHLARTDLESATNAKYAEYRDQREQQNRNVAAADAHDIAFRNKTILSNQIKEWHDAKNARDKELKARELEASLRSITSEMGLADSEFEKSLKYYLDEHGVLRLGYVQQGSKHLQHDANAVWDAIFSVIPIKSLGKNLLEGLVHIGG